jgi:hypothetical protein
MALTEDQKEEVFRYLRIPYPGAAKVDLAPPFSVSLGTGAGILGFPTDPGVRGLAYRLNNLSPDLELKLVGADHPLFDAYCGFASVQFQVTLPAPAANLQATLQVGPSRIAYRTAVSDTAAVVAAALATGLNADPAVSSFAIAIPATGGVTLTATQYGRDANAVSVAAYCSPGITIAVTSDGTTAARRLSGGKNPPGPRYVDTDAVLPMPIYGHLPIIRYWEDKIGGAADTMDVVKTGDVTYTRAEYAQRRAAFFNACRDLAQDLGVQFGAAGSFGGGGAPMRST